MFRRSGCRFGDKNMRQIGRPERVPIPQERNTLYALTIRSKHRRTLACVSAT
jgi:hypothetical protein